MTVILVTSTAAKPSDMPTLPPTPTVHTFHSINLMTPKVDWFMNHLSSSHHTDRLWANLLNGTTYAVSDGSYFPKSDIGAYAWIIATPDGSQWIQGGGIIPGEDEVQDPYRSELGGQLGLAAVITSIILLHNHPKSITVACAGKVALNRVNMVPNKKGPHEKC